MILSWQRNTAAKSAAPSRRHFHGVFPTVLCRFSIMLIFNAIHRPLLPDCLCKSSKTVQNASKTVNFASQGSQSRSPALTILRCYLDYFAPRNTQNDMPKGSKRHSKPCFPAPETWFPGISECARKCQPSCRVIFLCRLLWGRGELWQISLPLPDDEKISEFWKFYAMTLTYLE